MAHHQPTNVEVENKVAFFVQLNALLTRISSVVSSDALSSAQKAKLSDVRSATEAWLKDVGVISAPRPFIAAAPPPPPPTPLRSSVTETPAAAAPLSETVAASKQQDEEQAEAALTQAPEAPAAEQATATTSSAADGPARASASPATPGGSSTATAAVTSTHERADARKLVGLVSYLRLLFDSDVPERAKLQEFGKSLVRLLMVRCCSTIMASLQHVVHHTYIGTTTAAEEEGDAEAALSALFVQLAKEIDVATKALLGCVRLITSSAVLSEAASARFPVQLCVDVVKQTRRAQVYFQSRVEREEYHLLRTFVTSSDTAAKSTEGSLEDVDAVHDALESVSPERVAAHVLRRVEALRRRWGPSLVHSVRNIGDVIEPSVKFLATVAAVRAEGAPAPLVALKKDAAHDLFSLCEPVTVATTAAGGQPCLAKSLSTCDSPSVVAAPVSASSATPLAWRAAAGEVLIRLGSSFSADYLAAVAACCGDSNEGELLATRLLTDMLKCVAAHDLPLLRCVLLDGRWYRALYGGILNCVSSSQPAVLAAGLDALGLLTTACPVVIGREVGLLYSNVVLRLLESSNTPQYVKRTIVLHFVTTFMGSGSTLPADGGGGAIPLILHLYRLYDLNVHAHQLNLMQQLTSALSRIVRAAPKEELMQDAVVREQLQIQQEAAPSAVMTAPAAQLDGAQHRAEVANGTTSSEPSSLVAAALNPASLSLPAMALHGLVRIVELLTTQTPPEEESGKDVLASLPAMTCRESKLKEQQEVDRFNAAPKKAIYKLFNVTAEENAIPASHADFSSQWEHTLLPPLTSAAAAKVEAVADFLNQVSSLNPEAVSEFLTTPEVFPLQVCRTYLRRLPLAGCSVLEAISELLMRVQLPKEGQRIERLLEYFSAAYYEANRGHGIDSDIFPFKSDTAVFIVVVATVMLNTNIHNPSAGMRLDVKAFRGQLRRCNDDESFADSFVDDIFDCISTHPLESIKSIAADANASTDSTSRGSFDMFFVSQEEKRQLAFGVERQRMVSETRQLLKLRTQQEPLAPAPEGWWCAVAKDFFLSTWSSVCAVFGPAMYEGTTAAPSDVLLQCVRGLQSLLCMAAAFDLPTECTVTLLTLLRMADATPVREHCRRAVLVVAATTYAVNFPVRCWVAVCQIILEVRRTAAAATPPLVEDVFTRIEGITRLSVETEERRAADDSAPKTDRPTEAIHRAMEGVMTTISGYAVGDVANLSSALAVLRRALEYTRIVHANRRTDIVYFVNVRDFTAVVAPAYVELVKKHSSSDDGLQVLFECLVDLLCTMWVSYSTSRVMAPAPAAAAAAGKAETAETPTVDTAPAEFVQSFRFLRSVYDVTLASASEGAATLLQMHTLQAIKEVLSRTVRTAEMTAAGQHLSLYTMMASWQEVLYPLAVALCDRNSTAVEAGSLALLVLRKLVALCGGTGTASSDRLPGPVRAALLWLLAQLAYMGGMCGDADSAQVCVALLSSICTTTVAMSVTAASSSSPGCSTAGPASPVTAVADPSTAARLMEQRNALTQQVVTSIEENPHYVVQCTLARLCLLLQCEREQTRAEVMHQLRTLSLQMRPAQLCPMALDLAEVVLEGTIGHAAHHRQAPRTQSSLIPFLFFQMPVPASMRRCSRTSFRATVPAALGFLANELLTGLSGDDLAMAAESVMRRCLLPILLSPNSPHQCRFIAVRSLSQCVSVCLPQNSAARSPQLAQCVLDCLAMALYAVRVPLTSVVSPDTSFVGRRWLDAPAISSASGWAAYCAQATHTVELMDRAEPQWLVRGAAAAAAQVALSTLAATATEERDGAAATPTSSRGGCATSEETHRADGAAFVPDEALIEYVNLLAQMLAGVPKELQGVVASAAAAAGSATPSAGAVAVPDMNTDDWKLPRASVTVLLQLCLQAGGTLFAVLWRVNHPHEVEQYAMQSVESRREALAFTRNSGLLPHAAIRSVLQCYLKLAVLSTEYPSAELLEVTTDIIEGIRQVQAATHAAAPSPSPPSLAVGGGAGAVTAGASSTSLAADGASLQRLPPQEQQHVRTCNSGMYQQLSVVLGYLVRLLTGQSTSMASVAGWARRQEAFEAMALHPQFFSSLVSLLTPTAGMLIITVRDYFAWYIAHAQLPHQASEIAGPVTVSGGAACSGEATSTWAAESDEEGPSSSQLTALNGTHDGKGSAFGSYSVNGGGSVKLSYVKAARTLSPKPSTVGMARMCMTEVVSDVAAKSTRNFNSE
ncbi:Sec7 domain containing protein, putative [Leishmania donovani]|uniref:Sec7 domain containing protein, putative n=1 Tax=Leishmania donovani TaxID=5661 RepID=A0A3S5H5W1_LEIDO|nr:Sec7 domain containing protein, putative [Leishmania donovani]